MHLQLRLIFLNVIYTSSVELVQYHKRDSSYGLRGRALEWFEQSAGGIPSVQSAVTDISTLSIKNLGRHSLVSHSGGRRSRLASISPSVTLKVTTES